MTPLNQQGMGSELQEMRSRRVVLLTGVSSPAVSRILHGILWGYNALCVFPRKPRLSMNDNQDCVSIKINSPSFF